MTVKELMAKHYEAEQRENRSTLNEPLAPTRSGSSRPPPSREHLPELPRDGRLPQFEGVQSLVRSLIPPSIVAESERPRKKLRIFVATGIGIAVALIVGVLLVEKSATSGGQPAASVSPPEPRKPAAALEQTARQPSAGSTISLTLSAAPRDAEIRLDGRRISNPYRAAHGRDAISHHVTVSLDGYQTLEREISFANDLELQFSLDAASHGGGPRSKSRSAAVRQVEVNPPSANSAPLTPPASPTPPAGAPGPGEQKPAVLKPGDDLRRLDSRTLKTRDIDETDPYKR